MPNSVPYELVGLPADIYIAPTGTGRPGINIAPADPWELLGLNGALNYTPDGVAIKMPQSFNRWRSLGSAMTRKIFRTEEDFMVGVNLADLRLEALALLSGNEVQSDPEAEEVAAFRSLDMERGLTIATVALLVRVTGGSPYMEDGNLDIYVPLAQLSNSPDFALRRDNPAIVPMEWTALKNPSGPSFLIVGQDPSAT